MVRHAPTHLSEESCGTSLSQELLTALPIHPITVPVALRTGHIDGENQAKGVRLPLSDLLIGVTAIKLGYSVATANLRHFQMIPGLTIVPF